MTVFQHKISQNVLDLEIVDQKYSTTGSFLQRNGQLFFGKYSNVILTQYENMESIDIFLSPLTVILT